MAQHSNEHLQRVLQAIHQEEGDSFAYDADKITADAQSESSRYTNLPVKLLTFLGGFLATFFFLGFLFTTGLYNSNVAMLVLGAGFIAGSEVLNRLRSDLLLSTVSVSLYIVGYMLFGIGFSEISNDASLSITLAIVAAVFILVSDSAVLVFLSVLVLSGSLVSLPYIYKVPELLHAFTGVAAAILAYLSLHEANLISGSQKLNKLYGPLRMGMVLTLAGILVLLSHQEFDADRISYTWLSTVLLVTVLLVMLHRLMQEMGITALKTQLIIYGCCIVILAPTILTPGIAGALLIVLTGFYIGHRVSFAFGLLALGYFIVLFYYNLQITLLLKSGILALTGCLFLGGLFLFNRYIRSHAK